MATVSETSAVRDARSHGPLRRYANVAVTLHWTIVVLLLIQVWLGFTFADMPRGPERMAFFTWHKTIGATILLLTLVRLGYRLLNPPPPYPRRRCRRGERIAAAWNHRLFYFLLIALPLDRADRRVRTVRNGLVRPRCSAGSRCRSIPGISEATGEMSGERS